MIKINKIQLNNFRFFGDDEEHNTFELNGQNTLIYGENGSGKSSLFRAFEFLAQTKVNKEEFGYSKNIFGTQPPSLVFELDNDQTLIIDENHLENNLDYIKALSIFKPMLEYKNLLKIHYQTDKSKEEINIYEMLRDLFKEYPISQEMKKANPNLVGLERLGEIKNPDSYFNMLRDILNTGVLEDINSYLLKFNKLFHIDTFFFDKEFTEDGKVEFVVNVKIDFMENLLDTYHHFLNEAKLTALALAIHFAIIRNVSDKLENNSFKLLILDDLLISLDMSNRLNLIDLLKESFSDFQIFFFTHDKGLFEIFKDKMEWKAFEIYVKQSDGGFEVPFIKKTLTYFESAVKYFGEHDYPACANYLRKEVERLKKIKEAQEQIHNEGRILKKFKKMIYSFDLGEDAHDATIKRKLIGFKKGLEEERDSSVEIDLRNIKSITDRILNPQSHDDTSKPLYKKELEEAFVIIEALKEQMGAIEL